MIPYAEVVKVEAYSVHDDVLTALAANRTINDGGAKEFLTQMAWPEGLQDTLVSNVSKIAIRFFIGDDSGSMGTPDGNKVVGTPSNPASQHMLGCSRWEELKSMMHFHANLANSACALTEFRLLNSGRPVLVGDSSDPQKGEKLQEFLRTIDNSSPNNGTPLCRHITEVAGKVRHCAEYLRANAVRASVIIVTDGEASDGDLRSALRLLEGLPVLVTVRLCTNESNVVDYWTNIDKDLELNLDVLDDMQGEGKEIQKKNPWLVYGEALHRMREFGASSREFDLLDEKKLTDDEICTMCAIILGGKPSDYPHPSINFAGFKAAVSDKCAKVGKVWSPVHRKVHNWIEPDKLKKSGCVIA